MSEENARKKALLDKILAQRAETLALLTTTATRTSEREEDEEDDSCLYEWQTGEATGEATHVCMKDFHEGAFDSHNRTHLVTTLATIGKVFHVLLGNLWKDFTEIAIDRVNSQDATPLATEFMSWSIETTFRTVFSYLRSSYQQINSDTCRDAGCGSPLHDRIRHHGLGFQSSNVAISPTS